MQIEMNFTWEGNYSECKQCGGNYEEVTLRYEFQSWEICISTGCFSNSIAWYLDEGLDTTRREDVMTWKDALELAKSVAGSYVEQEIAQVIDKYTPEEVKQ